MTAVELRFLGCGDAFAGGGRLQSCLHLDGGGEPLLIDCGATTLVALKRAGIDPASISWVVLSHLHGDHFGGLPWLILEGRFAQRTSPLTVVGPAGSEERLRQVFEALYPGGLEEELPFALRFVEHVEGKRCERGPAVVSAYRVEHGGGAPPYALRVEYGGKVIAYSGDTEWTDVLLEVARGVDLFVCECNFFETHAPGHLDYRTLAEHLPLFQCDRIVLTHMSEEMLARLDEVKLETAEDGQVIRV